MLNPYEAVLALQKLILLHHKPRDGDELSPFIVCFDKDGTALDIGEVSAAHPKEMVGNLETWTPTPGRTSGACGGTISPRSSTRASTRP